MGHIPPPPLWVKGECAIHNAKFPLLPNDILYYSKSGILLKNKHAVWVDLQIQVFPDRGL